MNIICVTLQLNCFTSNSSVVLSAQTRHAIFTAQVLRDNSEDMRICQQLDDSVYSAKLIFGNHVYEYPTQLTYSSQKDLQINFPCLDANNCNEAFLAMTVEFQLSFSSSNTLVEDSVSDMKIDRYNRIDCIVQPLISADKDSSNIKILGVDNGCHVPFDQTKSATLTLIAHPDFKLVKEIQLTGINSVSELIQHLDFNCATDFVKTPQRTCYRLITYFLTEINSYAYLTIALPGLIPSNTSVYSRWSAYSILTEISTISSSFVEKFDCFQYQEAIIFPDMIRLNMPINDSKVRLEQVTSSAISTMLSIRFNSRRIQTFSKVRPFLSFLKILWLIFQKARNGSLAHLKQIHQLVNKDLSKQKRLSKELRSLCDLFTRTGWL
ncbi:Conserved_hypothetical protein [Hexamita inflata]|uniref:Uncharacterized protein n=1 Tax=Hexamita inflata TaxID=28002 RepID=A0AA86UW35_9EUKA|nr:Conserved hypothetical protein [Hexamita inflata]